MSFTRFSRDFWFAGDAGRSSTLPSLNRHYDGSMQPHALLSSASLDRIGPGIAAQLVRMAHGSPDIAQDILNVLPIR